MRIILSIITVLVLLGVVAADLNDPLTSELIAWMKANGAFISDKIEIKLFQPTGVAYQIRGVFAKEDLEEKETFLNVPWSLLVHPDPDEPEDDCSTAVNIFLDMKEERTPYGKYLKAEPRRYIREFWSMEGQQLLLDIIGEQLDPFFTPKDAKDYWEENCNGYEPEGTSLSDDLLLHAAMVIIARADDYTMIPFYDMLNHRNGKWYNSMHLIDKGNMFGLITKKAIKQGEQLFLSYNQCNACGNRMHRYGTASMFDSYGFVEPFPQRYVINQHRLKFDIDENENKDEESADGRLKVLWKAPPSPRGANFLKKQLQRLEQIEVMKEGNADSTVPTNEWNKVWELHGAYKTAFQLALESLEGRALTNKVFSMGHKWYVNEEDEGESAYWNDSYDEDDDGLEDDDYDYDDDYFYDYDEDTDRDDDEDDEDDDVSDDDEEDKENDEDDGLEDYDDEDDDGYVYDNDEDTDHDDDEDDGVHDDDEEDKENDEDNEDDNDNGGDKSHIGEDGEEYDDDEYDNEEEYDNDDYDDDEYNEEDQEDEYKVVDHDEL